MDSGSSHNQSVPPSKCATAATECTRPSPAGYFVRDGHKITSTMKEHFTWDEEEIDFMKQQRILDKTFNRRRDEFTRYVEKRAQYQAMTKSPKA